MRSSPPIPSWKTTRSTATDGRSLNSCCDVAMAARHWLIGWLLGTPQMHSAPVEMTDSTMTTVDIIAYNQLVVRNTVSGYGRPGITIIGFCGTLTTIHGSSAFQPDINVTHVNTVQCSRCCGALCGHAMLSKRVAACCMPALNEQRT